MATVKKIMKSVRKTALFVISMSSHIIILLMFLRSENDHSESDIEFTSPKKRAASLFIRKAKTNSKKRFELNFGMCDKHLAALIRQQF